MINALNTPNFWQCGRFTFDFKRPLIMGIVNVTPDSFSDGGHYAGSLKTILQHAETLLNEGADMLDIGGESTRPGAAFVSEETEWSRVQDVLRELATWNVPLSLDTRRVSVMKQTLESVHVDMINDVNALQNTGAIELLAAHKNVGVCLMHMQGEPFNMQQNPVYENVVDEVIVYLKQRLSAAIAGGIAQNRLVVDPGFGFGKALEHNLALFQNLSHIRQSTGNPLLVGVSRKAIIGAICGIKEAKHRVTGSAVAAALALQKGANIVRVHDVGATKQAYAILQTLAPQTF